MKHPEIKPFESCKRPALVRMNFLGKASFAFVGAERTAFLPAFVQEAGGEWKVHNLASEWGLLAEFETATAIDFGSSFDARPDYSANCQIKQGELFRTPGALIRAGDTVFLAAHAPQGFRDPIQYLELATGRLSGEPGGSKAAFGSWSLYASPDDQTPLFSVAIPT